MTRLSLGIFCPGNGTGGPWRYVHSILAALDLTEFDVTVFCDLPGAYDRKPGVKVVRLGNAESFLGGAAVTTTPVQSPRRRPSPARLVPSSIRLGAGFLKQARNLARLIRQHPLDLFHTQNTGCEESPVAARMAGVPLVLGTFHVDSTYDLHRKRNGPAHRLMEVVSNRCLDAAIAVSHATRRDWLRRTHIPAGRVVTIHNGIDPEQCRRRRSRAEARGKLDLPGDALLVGGLGRLDEAKGFTYLLNAAAMLRGEFPSLVVAIAGTGPLQKDLEAEASRLGISNCVRFLGFQSDPQLVLDALDVFALPSLCEALPYALLEAMATELPAVGSTVGGVPEVIVEGATGFLVRPRQPAELALALGKLLDDQELRGRLGVAARQRVVSHFQERKMAQQTVEIYRRIQTRARRITPESPR